MYAAIIARTPSSFQFLFRSASQFYSLTALLAPLSLIRRVAAARSAKSSGPPPTSTVAPPSDGAKEQPPLAAMTPAAGIEAILKAHAEKAKVKTKC